MKYELDYLEHPKKEIIEQRLQILEFYEEFGLEATRKAFNKSRSTIFLWKQKRPGLAASFPPWRRETGLHGTNVPG